MVTHANVTVIGAGVTGTAAVLGLGGYTNTGATALVEKYKEVATVNSHPLNNANSLHRGDTETNYDLTHALEVQLSAIAVQRYLERRGGIEDGLYRVTNRMVLGVGEKECATLRQRYVDIRYHYPELRLVEREELEKIEPMVVKGRDPSTPLCALVSPLGFAVNYQKLAEAFLEDAKKLNDELVCFFETEVRSVRRKNGVYILETSKGIIHSKVVVFATGPYSLRFAHKLGYGREYSLLDVAGSFYSSTIPNLLRGKVYTVQKEGVPFAAVHGDPDVLDGSVTRFGPTTKPLPLMERHHYDTFWDWLGTGALSPKGIWAIIKILTADHMLLLKFVLRSSLYDIPWLGQYLFLREAQKIVPTLRYKDLKYRKGAGGIRPQIFNKMTGELLMGEAMFYGDNAIFLTAPSPGATASITNGGDIAKKVVEFLGEGYHFDEEAFERDFGKPE